MHFDLPYLSVDFHISAGLCEKITCHIGKQERPTQGFLVYSVSSEPLLFAHMENEHIKSYISLGSL